MKKPVVILVSILAFLGAACAPSGEPDNYDDAVEANFMEACELAGDQAGQTDENLANVCGCAYAEFEENVPYDDFKAFDNELRDDPEAPFPPEYLAIFADCIRNAA